MLRGRNLDVALLLIVLILGAGVLALTALPEPPPRPEPTVTPTATFTLTPTATREIAEIAPRTPRYTSTPTATPMAPATVTAASTTLATTPTPRPTAPPGSTATPLPLVDRSAPLPHSAVFVRRHNDFAAPSTAAVADLVETGVTIDGTPIAFGAFEPLSGMLILRPDDGTSLAVRYGLAEIPLTRKRDARATHYLEIGLRAATSDMASAMQQSQAAPPANYVFVVDTSGSMDGAKLNGAKAAIAALFADMRPQDSLGIVDFDDQTRTVLPAAQVSTVTMNAFQAAVNQLVAQGGTDINLGLTAGLEEAQRFAGEATVTNIFLFSDGNPTDGVTEWLDIRSNIVDATHGAEVRISTFAFGEDANARELDALAGVTGGTYTLVTNPAMLGLDLTDELARRDRLAAKDIQMRIVIDPNIQILTLYAHDQVEDPVARAALGESAGESNIAQPGSPTDEEGLRIFVPDLALDETYWVVLEVAVPDGHSEHIGEATVTYVDTLANAPRQVTRQLSLTPGPNDIIPYIVVRHAVGLWTGEVVLYALDDVNQGDLQTAEARLTGLVDLLEAAVKDVQTSWLQEDVATLHKLLTLTQALATGTLDGPEAQDAESLLRYALDGFGRALSGFSRAETSSTP